MYVFRHWTFFAAFIASPTPRPAFSPVIVAFLGLHVCWSLFKYCTVFTLGILIVFCFIRFSAVFVFRNRRPAYIHVCSLVHVPAMFLLPPPLPQPLEFFVVRRESIQSNTTSALPVAHERCCIYLASTPDLRDCSSPCLRRSGFGYYFLRRGEWFCDESHTRVIEVRVQRIAFVKIGASAPTARQGGLLIVLRCSR